MNLRVVIRTADLDTVARSDSLSVSLCLISRQGDMTEVVNFSSKVCPHKWTRARGTTHVHDIHARIRLGETNTSSVEQWMNFPSGFAFV